MGGTRIKHINREQDRITAVEATRSGESIVIEAQHVVIAVGANIGFLRREGFLTYQPNVIRAARAYYANVQTPLKVYDFYFDVQLMPGYGWIFPTGDGTANIGVGHLPVFWAGHLKHRSTRTLLDDFIKRRVREGVLHSVEQIEPVRGYPLRTDFPRQRVAGKNWVIVGEAAGLVNPVTGEGIDLAIESGLLAANMLDYAIQHKKSNHAAYQHALWERFGPMFNGLRVLQNILVTPVFTDYALILMNQHRFLTRTILKIAQGMRSPESILHPLLLLQFFVPLTPRFTLDQVNAALNGKRTGQGHL
jgi:flavin-dependent dehydrogenase